MSLENADYISQLAKTNPEATDLVSEGDNHIRMIKKVLQNSFPANITSPLIPDTTDKGGNILTVNESGDGIEWSPPENLPTGSQYFRYWKSQDQVLDISQGTVKVLFDVEKEDPENQWVNSEWTVGVTGIYHIDAWWRITENAVVDHDMKVMVNGGEHKQLSYTDYQSGTQKLHSMQISDDMMLNAGDKVYIAARSESNLRIGGNSNALAGVVGYRLR